MSEESKRDWTQYFIVPSCTPDGKPTWALWCHTFTGLSVSQRLMAENPDKFWLENLVPHLRGKAQQL